MYTLRGRQPPAQSPSTPPLFCELTQCTRSAVSSWVPRCELCRPGSRASRGHLIQKSGSAGSRVPVSCAFFWSRVGGTHSHNSRVGGGRVWDGTAFCAGAVQASAHMMIAPGQASYDVPSDSLQRGRSCWLQTIPSGLFFLAAGRNGKLLNFGDLRQSLLRLCLGSPGTRWLRGKGPCARSSWCRYSHVSEGRVISRESRARCIVAPTSYANLTCISHPFLVALSGMRAFHHGGGPPRGDGQELEEARESAGTHVCMYVCMYGCFLRRRARASPRLCCLHRCPSR